MGLPKEQDRSADPLEVVSRLVLNGDAAQHPQFQTALAELQEACAEQDRREETLRRQLDQTEALLELIRDQMLRYRELFEYAPDAYLVTDKSGNIEEANHTATILLQTQHEFLIGKPLPFFIIGPDQREFYGSLAHLNLTGEGIQTRQVRLRPRRGRDIYAELSTSAVLRGGSTPSALRWLLRDVSKRHHLEESLRAERRFTDNLIEAAEVLILLLARDGSLLRTNAHLEAVTGYRRAFLAGDAWLDLFPRDERSRITDSIQLVLQGAGRRRWRSELVRRDGGHRTIAWSARLVVNPSDGSKTVLLVGHDITDLEEAQKHALRFERLAAIGEVTAGLAHESRNALQRGEACMERLRWKLEGQAGALDLLQRARTAHNDLIRLYESVRNYAAPIRRQVASCDPAEIWRQVWSDLLALHPRDAHLHEELATADRICQADRFRLGQVFRNLLDNALAACTDPAHIRITCRAEGIDRRGVQIAVRDNGSGFTPEQRDRLFQPFFTTKVKGTGLGMSIVKRIIEAHGGTVAGGMPAEGEPKSSSPCRGASHDPPFAHSRCRRRARYPGISPGIALPRRPPGGYCPERPPARGPGPRGRAGPGHRRHQDAGHGRHHCHRDDQPRAADTGHPRDGAP
jgi:PAS domain S-box-containing protein